ncbi:MAG: hypothetical protein GC182_12095 [Rhodopseudomonas sp.]|nr:hypothetical protein [Rhodopseudomonas sp.]
MWVDQDCRPARRPELFAGEAVSFDVFDTFLMRRCTTPDGVFERACRLTGCDVTRAGLVESFVQHRRLAEMAARKQSKARQGVSEVTIEQIYEHFPRRLFGLGALTVDDLAAAEFDAELELCVADADIGRLYDRARADGKRTGFISDTYWTGARLARLLRHCRPSLKWDFLYASCDHGSGKSKGLFEIVLTAETLSPAALLHIGDHPVADIATPRRLGVETRFHPQASDSFTGLLNREATALTLLTNAGATGSRLDGGLRSLRRSVARALPDRSTAFSLGATVLGPLMSAFDRFVADRVAALEQTPGRKVAVAFLARDGFLSHKLWSALRQRPTGYVEINRRAACLAAADGDAGFKPLFDPINRIDHATTVDMLNVDSPALRDFFRAIPGGIADGESLASQLPRLISRKTVARLARRMRDGLINHLRHAIPDYDACTDLVLVDLGYSASVQKNLRRAFDLAGAGPRLHGLYLLTKDDALGDIGNDNANGGDSDTAEGLISDLVVTPQVKHALLANIAVLEQLCCAQTGSVRDYRNGEAIRDKDHRDPDQVALSQAVQAGALHFAARLPEHVGNGLDPFADGDCTAAWAAALLARLLLMPTDDELLLLASARHDVNLGSSAVVALADTAKATTWTLNKSIPDACRMPPPPMWPAGSFNALSPQHGFLYTLFGAGFLPSGIFDDIPCGKVDVTLIDRQAAAANEARCLRTGHGDIRIHIPLPADRPLDAVAVAIGRIASHGLLRGVTLRQGETMRDALRNVTITTLTEDHLQGVDLTLNGSHYRSGDDGKLLILLPPLNQRIGVITLLLTPLGGQRVLALAEDEAQRIPIAPLALAFGVEKETTDR